MRWGGGEVRCRRGGEVVFLASTLDADVSVSARCLCSASAWRRAAWRRKTRCCTVAAASARRLTRAAKPRALRMIRAEANLRSASAFAASSGEARARFVATTTDTSAHSNMADSRRHELSSCMGMHRSAGRQRTNWGLRRGRVNGERRDDSIDRVVLRFSKRRSVRFSGDCIRAKGE